MHFARSAKVLYFVRSWQCAALSTLLALAEEVALAVDGAGEVALAEILTLLVLDDEHLLGRLVRGKRLLDEVLGGILGAIEEEREVGRRAGLLPRVEVEVLGKERVGGELADVLEVGRHLGGVEERVDVRLGGAGDLGHHGGHLRLDGGLVGALGLGVLVDDGVGGLTGGDEEGLVRAESEEVEALGGGKSRDARGVALEERRRRSESDDV